MAPRSLFLFQWLKSQMIHTRWIIIKSRTAMGLHLWPHQSFRFLKAVKCTSSTSSTWLPKNENTSTSSTSFSATTEDNPWRPKNPAVAPQTSIYGPPPNTPKSLLPINKTYPTCNKEAQQLAGVDRPLSVRQPQRQSQDWHLSSASTARKIIMAGCSMWPHISSETIWVGVPLPGVTSQVRATRCIRRCGRRRERGRALQLWRGDLLLIQWLERRRWNRSRKRLIKKLDHYTTTKWFRSL